MPDMIWFAVNVVFIFVFSYFIWVLIFYRRELSNQKSDLYNVWKSKYPSGLRFMKVFSALFIIIFAIKIMDAIWEVVIGIIKIW